MKNIKPTRQSTDGTSFFGQTITAPYSEIISIFGKPVWEGCGDKVSSEWELELSDGTVFTIYDWKEGSCPFQNQNVLYVWHIGSHRELTPEQYTTIKNEFQS